MELYPCSSVFRGDGELLLFGLVLRHRIAGRRITRWIARRIGSRTGRRLLVAGRSWWRLLIAGGRRWIAGWSRSRASAASGRGGHLHGRRFFLDRVVVQESEQGRRTQRQERKPQQAHIGVRTRLDARF